MARFANMIRGLFYGFFAGFVIAAFAFYFEYFLTGLVILIAVPLAAGIAGLFIKTNLVAVDSAIQSSHSGPHDLKLPADEYSKKFNNLDGLSSNILLICGIFACTVIDVLLGVYLCSPIFSILFAIRIIRKERFTFVAGRALQTFTVIEGPEAKKMGKRFMLLVIVLTLATYTLALWLSTQGLSIIFATHEFTFMLFLLLATIQFGTITIMSVRAKSKGFFYDRFPMK